MELEGMMGALEEAETEEELEAADKGIMIF
jgi:hypothetical protein